MKVRYTVWTDDEGRRQWHFEGPEGPKALPANFDLQFLVKDWPIGTTIEVDLATDENKLQDRFRELLERTMKKQATGPRIAGLPAVEEVLAGAVATMMVGQAKQRTELEAQLLKLGLAVERPEDVDSGE